MDNKIVALYVRVSTGHQVDKCSLPFQKKELQSYCEHILHITQERIEIFEDAGRSAKNTKRPAFERMMGKVRAGEVSHVIVYKIDRISRNLVDFSVMYDDFKYNKVTFISLNEQFDTSSALGEAVLKIILVFAELERKLTAERVTSIMLDRAAQGLWNGSRVPYGWDWCKESKMPVHSPSESPHGRTIYDLYEKTRSSVQVRDYLNKNHIPTKRGGTWTTKTISDFIRNPINRGDYRYNYRESARGRKKAEEEVIYLKGIFPPLVSPDQWDRCNRIMDNNSANMWKNGRSHAGKHIHVFAGLLRCGYCGSSFQASKKDRVRKNGFTPTVYSCSNHASHGTCTAPGISDVTLGPFIFNYIANVVRASGSRRNIHTPEELEKFLLSGPEFSEVVGIGRDGLETMFYALSARSAAPGNMDKLKLSATPGNAQFDSSELDSYKQKLEKIVRALERLKRAYLFDDSSMSEKEYLETKADLDTQRVSCSNKIKELSEKSYVGNPDEMTFIHSASAFLLSHEIQSGHISYKDLAPLVGHESLKEIVHMVIENIVILDSKPVSITFKNGLVHKFLYQ